MNVFHRQIYLHILKFETALTDMAWSIVDRVLEEHRKKLVGGLAKVAIKADAVVNRSLATAVDKRLLVKNPPRVHRVLTLLDSKKGKWDRGGGVYKVVGPGKKPETFDLENIFSGKKINATLKTLASRWKHTP